MNKWSTAITSNLWPYVITNAAACIDDSSEKTERLTRVERFTSSNVRLNLRHNQLIGVPVYVLMNDLQAGRNGSKWCERSKIEIYVGKSSRHARNIAWVLNLEQVC
jgi:hypothetical protein